MKRYIVVKSKMATAGSYCNLSDEYHDFACSSCAKEGKNVVAVKFCVDCHHLLCSTCLGHHNKFDVMKSHQILDKTAAHGRNVKDKPALPTYRCERHDGKILDIYCRIHEEPCCSVCATVDHRVCTAKDFLPDFANRYFRKSESDALGKIAEKSKSKLKEAKAKYKQGLKESSDQIAAILDHINEKRAIINKRLDRMEKEIKAKLDEKFIENSTELITAIEDIENSVKNVEEIEEKNNQGQPNKSDEFIVIKLLEKRMSKVFQFEENPSDQTRKLRLVESRPISNVLEALGSDVFGHVSSDGEIEAALEDCDVNIKSQNDKFVSCISDSCLMEDGSIIVTDQNNRKLKILDRAFQLKDTFDLPGKPCAVCPTGKSEVAVSILSKKSIEFVNTTKPMSITNSFRVGESCRGIAYYNGQLYLSCGGMLKFHDSPGGIRIYDKCGNLVCRTDTEVVVPKRISVGASNMFISDEEKGVLCLNHREPGFKIRNLFNHTHLKATVGICYAGLGQIVVTGYESNNVVLISSSGSMIRELMSNKQGINKPKTVCFDKTGSKMMVGMTDVDFVKVMHVIRK